MYGAAKWCVVAGAAAVVSFAGGVRTAEACNPARIARWVHELQFACDEDDREDAAEELGEHGGPDVVPFLARAASFDPCCDVRKEAACAIGRIQRRFPHVPIYGPLTGMSPDAALLPPAQPQFQPAPQFQPQPQPQFVPQPQPQFQPQFQPPPVPQGQPQFEPQPDFVQPPAIPQRGGYGSRSGSAQPARGGTVARPVAPATARPVQQPQYEYRWDPYRRAWVLVRR